MDASQPNRRQLILDTALDIIENEGMKALTQPRIAKVAGLRQSHLTYYFPRKADLYIALLEASHERAERRNQAAAPSLGAMLQSLFFVPERMRFFLSIVLEVGEDPDLKSVVAEHAAGLCREVAGKLGLTDDDARVVALVDELRGIGMRLLVEPPMTDEPAKLLRDLALRHGLDPRAFE
nr:TetR family transcriptional regulator [Rhizobium sp. ACO-34A]